MRAQRSVYRVFQTALPPGISQGFEGQGAPTLPSSKDNRHLSHNSSHSRNFGGLRLERSECLGGRIKRRWFDALWPAWTAACTQNDGLFTLSASNRRGISTPRTRGNDRPHLAGRRCRFCSLPRRGDVSTWTIQ